MNRTLWIACASALVIGSEGKPNWFAWGALVGSATAFVNESFRRGGALWSK